jgi:hypothetical protein
MTTLKELPLGEDGVRYVRSCLEDGTSLSQEILRQAFTGGTACALVPEGVGLTRAKDFDTGGLMSRGDMQDWLVDHLLALCRAEPESTIVFEDPWGGRRGDPAVMAGRESKFFHGSFVYYFVEARAATDHAIRKAMNAVASYLFIAALARFPLTSAKLPDDRSVGDAVVRALAESTQEVFVEAYDQEGLVIWERSAKASGGAP